VNWRGAVTIERERRAMRGWELLHGERMECE